MKKLTYPMIAVAGLLIASAGQAMAGGNGSCCDDGIAASPKVRAMIDERCQSRCASSGQVTTYQNTTHRTDVAASPKVQQLRSERSVAPAVVTTESAGYRPTGQDGITASPKVRAMLDERREATEIAPLK